MSKTETSSRDNFSVALGLTDYGNPILYLITCITILCHLPQLMNAPWSWIYVFSVLLSVGFGFAIPTVKLLVGLGRLKFSLPVHLVFFVNFGIFLSGLMLLRSALHLNPIVFTGTITASLALLAFVYGKSGRFNSVAVMTGALGYLMIYIALISLSIWRGLQLPIWLYGAAICLYLMLIGIGLFADLKDARIHWIIEIFNILCQGCVTTATLLVFGVL